MANVQQAEYAVRSAQTDQDQATSNFRKITYPYTYSTFALDIPQALDSISSAERQVADALKVLQTPGLTTTQYSDASKQLQLALDDLLDARQRLGRGQGQDVFSSGLLTVNDYWTLRDAQLRMDKAQLGVATANGALNIAQLALDNAKSLAVSAQVAVDVAKSSVDKAQAALNNAYGVLIKSEMAVDKARYDVDSAREALDDATIIAPFDGVVAVVNVKAGDILTPADYTRTIFELVDSRRMEVTIKVDEMDVPGVQPGQEATISVDALPALKLKGNVTFVSPVPTVEGGVVQYKIKVRFDAPEGKGLKSGMSSTANIMIAQRNGVLLVPNKAVTRNRTGGTLVKLMVNGETSERVVQAGASSGTDTEIISGLSEGDSVVIETAAK